MQMMFGRCAATISAAVLMISGIASGQCQLANPSFDRTSAGFPSGWNRYGTVSIESATVSHGPLAGAAIVAATTESGFWQQLDASSGQIWRFSCEVATPPADPLSNGASAVVKVEWYNGGSLIDTDTHTALTDGASPGEYSSFEIPAVGPAPSGTTAVRIVLSVLKPTGSASGTALYDLAFFDRGGRLEGVQWNDFPGGRSVQFAGRSWRVKGDGFYGPGPNVFSDSTTAVSVDADGMHMSIRNVQGTYQSTEVVLEQALGYGDYVFTTKGRLDTLHENTVFGLFTWQYPVCYDGANPWNLHNEFDVEISRWGDPRNSNAQFVAQPYDYPGNISRFNVNYSSDDELVSYAFRWLPREVECRVWRGGPDDESPATTINTWTYTGPHIPRPELSRVHINLWHIAPPTSNQEVIVNDFRFLGLVPTGACCNGTTCSDGTEADCALIGGVYQGDHTTCASMQCTFSSQVELRMVTPSPDLDDGPLTVFDPEAGVDLLVQAHIIGDANASGLVTFDGQMDDDGSGVFAPSPLTSLEAIGFDLGGPDPSGRTGMFPSYRSTIGNNNENDGNGRILFDLWSFLPLNIAQGGNGEGINGEWTNVYKVHWTSTDTAARSVDVTVGASFGGYQSTIGLQQPVQVASDTVTLVIDAVSCPCEFSADSTVDIVDLLNFLSLWYAMDPNSDITDDGITDVADLLVFLSCWFPASSGSPCS